MRRTCYLYHHRLSADKIKLCVLPVSVAFAFDPVLISAGGCAFICRAVLMCARRLELRPETVLLLRIRMCQLESRRMQELPNR